MKPVSNDLARKNMPPRMLSTIGLTAALLLASVDTSASDNRSADRILDIAADWQPDLLLMGVLLLFAAAYGTGLWKIWRDARKGHGSLLRRALCFCGAWFLLVIMLVSPLSAFSEYLFSLHVLQDQLLMLAVAPLLVLAKPFDIMTYLLPVSLRVGIARGSRHVLARTVSGALTCPIVAWTIYACVFWWSLAPGWADGTAVDPAWLPLQHGMTLFASALFWWSIVGDNARRPALAGAVMYLMTTMMHSLAIGVLLACAADDWYPGFSQAAGELGMNPVMDQHAAGALIIAAGVFVYIGAAILLGAGPVLSWRREVASPPSIERSTRRHSAAAD